VEKQPEIVFEFIVSKVQTMADGSPRLILDLPETCIKEMAMLAEGKLKGFVFEAHVIIKK
jgi:hypothetical protein